LGLYLATGCFSSMSYSAGGGISLNQVSALSGKWGYHIGALCIRVMKKQVGNNG
jgi:hypothetical protein